MISCYHNQEVLYARLTPELVCALDADITFESCDHVLFKVHRKNLEVTSEGFSPPSGTIATHEVIPLIERAEVLDLLFQYMYPQRLPDLASVPFAILADLAEAAEKYQLYVAMKFCNMLMKCGSLLFFELYLPI